MFGLQYCCACHPTVRGVSFNVDHSEAFDSSPANTVFFMQILGECWIVLVSNIEIAYIEKKLEVPGKFIGIVRGRLIKEKTEPYFATRYHVGIENKLEG